MPNQPNSGRSGRGRNKSSGNAHKQLIESLREACPSNKQGDLERLVKSLKGDEAKIREQISEWWENPVAPATEEWNAVQKQKPPRRGGRGGRGGRGRGGSGGDRKRSSNKKSQTQGAASANPTTPASAEATDPVANGSTDTAPSVAQPDIEPVTMSEQVPPPSPSPVVPTPQHPKSIPATGGSGNNVWATRGSAHLIQAENPPPNAAPVNPRRDGRGPKPPGSPKREIPAPIEAPPRIETNLPSMATIEPQMEAALEAHVDVPMEVPIPPPIEVHAPMPAPAAPWSEKQESLIANAAEKKHGTILNMGRWETNETADSVDFAFGSFGDDAGNMAEVPTPSEPARPPPGLSMPPMPTNAVSVSDLENKLDDVVIHDKPVAPVPNGHPQEIPYTTATNSTATSTTTSSSNYGVAGPYNQYSNANSNSFLATKTPFNSSSSVTTPSPAEVQQQVPVPPAAYGNPMYYPQHMPHMNHHQPPYNHAAYGYHGQIPGHQFPGYHPPNYSYDDGNAAAAGNSQYQKNLRGRNNQGNNNYQNYGHQPHHPYMPYDHVRYQDPYHQQQNQQQQQQAQNNYFPDQQHQPHDSYKKKGGGARLHQFRPPPSSTTAAGPLSQQPAFLQQQPQHQQQPPQHEPHDWQSSGGGAWASTGSSAGPTGWHGGAK